LLPLLRQIHLLAAENCKLQDPLSRPSGTSQSGRRRPDKQKINFFQENDGLPDVKSLNLMGKNQDTLVIIDDLANLCYSSPAMGLLFSNVSNHERELPYSWGKKHLVK
jgi:hypothetical protein